MAKRPVSASAINARYATRPVTGTERLAQRMLAFVRADVVVELAVDGEQRLLRHHAVHEADPEGARWADGVSPDPDDAHFSFSVGGRAFFVVGLHPLSSRLARRFRWPIG